MRNLKKLFAVVMTVAMLVSVMVPALAADGFKYEADAQKLYDLGLFKGNSETSFVPDLGATLNRQAGLALAIRLMGKDAEVAAMSSEEVATQLAKIVDADEITDWAKPYAAYAVKNGLTNGIDASILPNVKFGSQLDLTGKEFINFVLKAMGYQAAWDDVLAKAADVGMLTASQAVTVGTTPLMTRDAAVGVMASALGGTTSGGITLAQKLVEDGAVSGEAMATAGYFAPTVAPTKAPAELTFTASTPNNIQINVVYSEEVEKDSAEKVDNYKLSKGGIEKATLQDDGVTVLLTLKYADAKKQQDKVDLTVKNVKTAAGVQIAETKLEGVEFLDRDIPTVVDAVVVGKDTIKVIFSEPMKADSTTTEGDVTTYFLSKDGFVVNGGKLYVRQAKLQNNYTEALVQLYSSLAEGEVSIQIKSNAEDFAGFGVIGKLITLNVVKDTEAPVVVGFEKATPNGVTLIWSEEVDFDGKTLTEWYHTNGKNTVDNVTIDGTKTTLKFTDDYKLPQGTAYVYVLKEAVKDLWGNKNAQQMVNVEVTLDETAPEVSKVEQGSTEKLVKVTYNEPMDSDSTKKAANYTILDNTGEEQKNIVKGIELDTDKKVATLTLDKNLGGDYSIVIKGVKDAAGNEIVEVTMPFTVVDKTNPERDDFTATLYNGSGKDQMLKVSFGETMATEGQYAINDTAKYMFGTKTLKSIKNVTITVVDNGKAVEIKVPSKTEDDKTNGYDITDAAVIVARVADAAGNYVQINKEDVLQFDVPITGAGFVKIDSAEATARNVVKVTFADEVKFEVADFTVVQNTYSLKFAAVETTLNDKGKTVATFTLIDDDKLATDFATGAAKFVVRAQDNVLTENKYGREVLTGNTDIKDKIAPELYNDGKSDTDYGKTDDGVKDYLKFDKDNFKFTLYFNDFMKSSLDARYAGSDFVVKVGDKTLVNGKDYQVTAISETSNEVVFEFIKSATSFTAVKDKDGNVTSYKVDGDFSIELATKINYVSDKSGNAPKAFDAIQFEDLSMTAGL